MPASSSSATVTWRDGPARSAPFVGRERECRLLTGLVAAVDGGGAAAVVTGEAGIGKTALLERTAAASTCEVRRVRGVEAEAAVPFAAAADLLLPLRDHFGTLPRPQRQALRTALALGRGPAGTPLAVCAGALGVLAAAGAQRPQLVLVDDVDRVDRESRQVLAFVARRLGGDHVVMLFAARETPGCGPTVRDLPTLPLTGLSRSECAELAAEVDPSVPPDALAEIVTATGGNPLAFLEALAAERRQTDVRRVPLAPSVLACWTDVLAGLPDRTRTALFVLAVDTAAAGAPGVADVLDGLGLSLDDLQPAERVGLVDATRGIALRHPLLREVMAQVTPLGVRVRTYRVLAGLAGAELRPWYLSLAATGPDERVATALEEAADETRRRRGRHAALRLARRSAELSTDPSAKARRLVGAAADALAIGGAASALRWCREAAVLGGSAETVSATLVLGRALTAAGQLDEACETLLRAAADPATGPTAAAALRAEATLPAVLAGDVDRARRTAPDLPATADARARVLVACVHVLRGDLDRGGRILDGDLTDAAPETAAHLGRGLVWAERFDRARPVVDRAVDDARRDGAAPALALALVARAELETWTGRWAAAYADAGEALSWAEELEAPPLLGHALAVLARLDAARGDHREGADHVERARREAGPVVLGWLGAQLAGVAGLSALGRGEPDAAIEHLEAARAEADRAGLGNPVALPIGADLAEAHLRCGRPDRAAAVVGWLRERAAATGLAWPTVAASRCAGLATRTEDAAREAFAEARRPPVLAGMPFERGRTLLAEGEVLRRLRRPLAARAPLRAAEALFDALGAADWARRSRVELAAAGARKPAAATEARRVDTLTPQELQIARLVAAGHNNVEVAAALYVSRKTVEAHLTRVYRKLAVRSRTDLARVLHTDGVLG